ncbi:aspartate/glutamate racemase family protein [Pseudomonas proteolytica]|uniref:Amino acid racemase n=1 Tax=Pseudomonas proteolytica TaxID=219574 RepID=A0AAW5AGS4_9PSED|nr:aspartate/glutamate racemase family protein [Pseudomonas proteolytica]KAA8701382.1 aspartate/glutamate racemase family protein [Pseudomonas proteolytica]MCF5060010.1 amino acid racemase [Pseudomonas proteolytica]MCF5102578.1 amino acid racemase [Pseudomonas proteolytica]TWR81783.1 aspartate/glutamate racemase family protein [Pseudomonas proteolytica]SEE28842.1 aspartate racemase [Pseudomonas proteolytica]
MRTIGLIGGMSWESSAEYYRIINQQVRDRLGPLRSAQMLLYSVDFGPVEQAQHAGRWDDTALILQDAARRLQAGGADCIVLCTNTMHLVAPQIEAAVSVPFLHIADAAGAAAVKADTLTVGLLGTAFTMEQDFLKTRLAAQGLNVLVPDAQERRAVHRIIYEELCVGVISEASRQVYQQAIANLAARGAQAIILGCTEIGLLIKPEHSDLPLLDTTELHAQAAVAFALGDQAV